MKKILYSILLILPFIFGSCDTIPEENQLQALEGETSQTTPITESTSNQRILLEDYTGWACPNCPAAAVVAEDLSTTHGNKFVVMAIHTGVFAKPSATNHNLDFRTKAGDDWKTEFAITSYPSGVINRVKYGSAYSVSKDDWAAKVSEQYANMQHLLDINLGAKADTITKKILISVENKFLSNVDFPTLINIVVVESGIIGVQQDGANKIMDYEFKHILRDNPYINFPLTQASTASGETIKKNYLLNIDPDIKDITKCQVIVFVTNANTKEIVNVNKIYL